MKPPRYTYVNESLDAIVKGLDLQPSDNVLAVAGCGDQAFAMLESGCRVTAVDVSPSQIFLVRKRVQALHQNDGRRFLVTEFDEDFAYWNENVLAYRFLAPDCFKKRNNYYSKPGRLAAIQQNLGNLTVEHPTDIIPLAGSKLGFTKIYLSNILFYDAATISRKDITGALKQIATNLPAGGLIYVADHDEMFEELGNFLPKELFVDEELTRKAKSQENCYWKPAVYRKVEVLA
ncbi:DUF3419 family protein [archaeon]|nr:DUF3419 family protein [archaeon]